MTKISDDPSQNDVDVGLIPVQGTASPAKCKNFRGNVNVVCLRDARKTGNFANPLGSLCCDCYNSCDVQDSTPKGAVELYNEKYAGLRNSYGQYRA